MTRTPFTLLPTLVALLCCGVPSAYAESVPIDVQPTDCTTPGWMLDERAPAVVGNLPELPVVLLPVVPTPGAPLPEPPLVSDMLSVVVTDADGAPVAGGPFLLQAVEFVAAFETVTAGRAPFLAWRPAAALAPGVYRATVTVTRPSVAYNTWACTFQDFERVVTFTVVAELEPAPNPTITLELAEFGGQQQSEGGVECEAGDTRILCADGVNACCIGPRETLGLDFKTFVSRVSLADTKAAYYGVVLEMDAPNRPAEKLLRVEYLLDAGGPYTSVFSVLAVDGVIPELGQSQLCARVVLLDLTTGEVAASASDCIATADRTPANEPLIAACPESLCVDLSDPEPRAEPTFEPGPEAMGELGVEPVPEDAPDVGQVGADTTTSSAETTPREDSGGCGAGSPTELAGLCLALTLFVWRRRTRAASAIRMNRRRG